MFEQEKRPPAAQARLTPIAGDCDLLPWRCAKQLKICFLYWLPVRSFPLPADQREWLLSFLELFAEAITKDKTLRLEQFVLMKALQSELRKPFLERASELGPVLGLGRRPGAALPSPPTEAETKALQEGRKKFDFGEFTADYCYWLRDRSHKSQRELFFGHSGMAMVFLKPDPGIQLPKISFSPRLQSHPLFQPLFSRFNLEKQQDAAQALLDGFLPKSRKLFGEGLSDDPRSKGLLFILPLLESRDFFGQSSSEAAKWFEFCDVYVKESSSDAGLLIASKRDLHDLLLDVVGKLRSDGRLYSE